MPNISRYSIRPFGELIDSGEINWPLLAPDGSVSAPSYSFSSATGDGMYWASDGLHVESDGPYLTAQVIPSGESFPLSYWQIGYTGTDAVGNMRAYNSATEYSQVTVSGKTTDPLLIRRVGSGSTNDVDVYPTYTQFGKPLYAPDGTAGAPAYSFASDTDTGIRLISSDIGIVAAGFDRMRLGTFLKLRSDAQVTWSSTADPSGTADLILHRDAAGILAQRNSTNAQTFRIYNTYTDASNYERVKLAWNGTAFILNHEGSGTGSQRAIHFNASDYIWYTANTQRWVLEAAGTFRPYADNTYNIGSSSVRVQDTYTNGLLVASAAKTSGYTVAAGDSVIECDASSAAFTVTLPAAASHDGRVIYVKKTDSSANAVTIDGNGSETIDGATTVDVLLQYECLQLVCNGTGWSVV